MGESGLLVNLTIALTVAFVGATIATRLGQSTILGFIAAGIVIGPYTPGFVGDNTSVEALADIGIILLMFAIGVQFSLRDLLRYGRIATFGASVQILAIIGLGYAVGKLLGWGDLEALFFGAVISNSSSTVIGKVLGERGEAGSSYGQLGVAWSSVQDLSTIVMVVVFTAVATGETDLGVALIWALAKATAFLVLLIPIGSRILSWLIERVAAQQNRETFILTVGAVALGTAYGSSLFGLSLALGAFVAGIVVSESDISHQILDEVIPLRDIFAGLFFVSVGMLVDPAFVISNLHLVAIGVALTVLAKGVIVAAIMHVARNPAQLSILTAATLAQSAEFSFLLARLGISLDVISNEIFNVSDPRST